MYITYHEEMELPAFVVATISQQVLSKEIKDFAEQRGVVQDKYYFKSLPHLLRLYLTNGDCIDCQLS